MKGTLKETVQENKGAIIWGCATAAVVIVIITILVLVCFGKLNTGGSSSASGVSKFGSAEKFDYKNFSYSNGLDENGHWEGLTALDYVTLPEDYNSIPIKLSDVEPSDDEVQTEIDSLLEKNATTQEITDRKAEDGDTVNIDYVGTVDGVAFSGGSYSGYSLTLGSGSFIDDFEDQIVGHTPGETFDVTVTFPDGYSDSTDSSGNTIVLANKEAVFFVTLNYISEDVVPELTDAWVDAAYGTTDDLHTVDELKAKLKEMLYDDNLKTATMDYLLANSTFSELPEQITTYQIEDCLSYYYTMADYYGYDLEGFVTDMMGYASVDAMLAQMDDSIEAYSKQALLYQAVAEAMDIVPTQEQIDVYADYVSSHGENYCKMVAMMDAVTEALAAGAQVA